MSKKKRMILWNIRRVGSSGMSDRLYWAPTKADAEDGAREIFNLGGFEGLQGIRVRRNRLPLNPAHLEGDPPEVPMSFEQWKKTRR